MLVLVTLVQMLCVASTEALTSFPSKFLAGEVSGRLVLTCDAPPEHVQWQQNGDPEIMAEYRADGRTLTLEGLDLPAAGNYSCWLGARLLDSTYVVVRDPQYPLLRGPPERALSCRAESYRGELRCSWTALRPAAFRARLSRSPGARGPWRDVRPDAARSRHFSVVLADPSFCPFAEEPRPLELELEGISADSFVSLTHRLFLRDVVRPGPPEEVAAHSEGGQLHLSWAPPASWSSPPSYFLLRYQLEYEHSDGTTSSLQLEGVTETSVEGDVRRVQIRCQDPLINSTWSPWTTWPNV